MKIGCRCTPAQTTQQLTTLAFITMASSTNPQPIHKQNSSLLAATAAAVACDHRDHRA
jgi:hypothetical protein